MINLRDWVHNFFFFLPGTLAPTRDRPVINWVFRFNYFPQLFKLHPTGAEPSSESFPPTAQESAPRFAFSLFAWVNEVFEVTVGGILDCERSAVALHFSSGVCQLRVFHEAGMQKGGMQHRAMARVTIVECWSDIFNRKEVTLILSLFFFSRGVECAQNIERVFRCQLQCKLPRALAMHASLLCLGARLLVACFVVCSRW